MYFRNGALLLLLFTLLVLLPLVYLKKNSEEISRFHSIPVTLLATGEQKIYRTDLETYLIGVIAAEMPAEFTTEALKAQAVAARTLAIKRLPRFGGRGSSYNRGVDFSDDPGESQAWLSTAGLVAKWGRTRFQGFYAKIYQAVRATEGIIMTYHNQPIDAVFHSTCGNRTAAAEEVWHNQVPYLQSESCGFDRRSPRYRSDFYFPWHDLATRLQIPENAARKIKIAQWFPDGRVAAVSFGNQQKSGAELRRMLGLNSTYIGFKTGRDGINLVTAGYGHGVGLCQYGADGMARQGYTYIDILKHYYRGIEFRKVKY